MIKTFLIKAEPTSRDQKDLAANIDKAVNEFLTVSGNDGESVSVSADLTGAFPQAVVIIKASADEIEKYNDAKRPKPAKEEEGESEEGGGRHKRGRRSE